MERNIMLFFLSIAIKVSLFLNPLNLTGFMGKIPEIEIRINPLQNVRTYKVYYDFLNPEIIEDIKKLDLVILEPTAVTAEEIRKIHEQEKTLVYGYISVIDIELHDSLKLERIKEEDYLKENGEKVYIPEDECYLADISSSHYHDVLLELIQKKIIDMGFDGVFLDTLDRLDRSEEEKYSESCKEFFIKLKKTYKDLSIIQNRAFKLFSEFSSIYVDGIMYEDFNYDMIRNSSYYQRELSGIIKASNRYNCKVLAITFDKNIETKKFCKDNRWIYLYHPEDSVYNTWYK